MFFFFFFLLEAILAEWSYENINVNERYVTNSMIILTLVIIAGSLFKWEFDRVALMWMFISFVF